MPWSKKTMRNLNVWWQIFHTIQSKTEFGIKPPIFFHFNLLLHLFVFHLLGNNLMAELEILIMFTQRFAYNTFGFTISLNCRIVWPNILHVFISGCFMCFSSLKLFHFPKQDKTKKKLFRCFAEKHFQETLLERRDLNYNRSRAAFCLTVEILPIFG